MSQDLFELADIKPELVRRLKRIEGQARGIQGMLADGRDCEEIFTQVAALKAAVEQVGVAMVACLLENSLRLSLQTGADTSEAVAQAKKMLSKL
ncbi:MAG: metal-sensitive transcriptional regulator [Firmicutes bacterium]|nr:metal-sensitive transcriptional regulator [Bacillota bacterium]